MQHPEPAVASHPVQVLVDARKLALQQRHWNSRGQRTEAGIYDERPLGDRYAQEHVRAR
jgi:hypothetical protein